MLDALMGADRNAAIPQQQQAQAAHGRRKRSCYDPAVCPLYCSWGTDLHELFTNTKSDIGPNPRVCDDDAREEYRSLPGHEQERLGFDAMLYERLRDLVRGCDRIVNRNKDKLRQEVARQQRARQGSTNGGNTNADDPAANISEDKVRKVASDRARLELLEEDVGRMVAELESLDEEEEGIVSDLAGADAAAAESTETVDGNAQENEEEKAKEGTPTTEKAEEEVKEGDEASNSTKETKEAEEEEAKSASEPPMPDDESKTKQTKLAEIRARKRSVLAALSTRIEQAVPLREAIAGDTRYLHHFRSNHTIDKCVCDVSGNFMSFRDADERIAAHYAGKQYVGWKMVRDKLDELRKKYGNGGPPPPPRGPPPGCGPPSRGGGYRRGEGGGGGGGGGGGDGRRRDRSRSRERNRDRDRDRHRGGRRRSPDRWERDRAPRDGDRSRGGGGGRRDRRY